MLKDAFFSDIAGCSSHSFLQVFKLMNIMNEEHLTRFNLPHMYNMPKKNWAGFVRNGGGSFFFLLYKT